MPYENLANWPLVTEAQRVILCRWVQDNFIPIQSINEDTPLSKISQWFVKSPKGFHVPNAVIRDAMLDCGYRARKCRNGDYLFNISEKSPAMQGRFQQNGPETSGERHIQVGGGPPWRYPHP